MKLKFRFPLRHPLFPGWDVTPARSAHGRCTALSGTYADLLEAAGAGISAERAVFVMHGPETPLLSEARRDILWSEFQVPVLACLLDGDGRLVGYECENQDGLHIGFACTADAAKLMVSGEDSILGYKLPLDNVTVDSAPCECGRPGPRLRFTGERAPVRRLEVVADRARLGPAPETAKNPVLKRAVQ